MLRRSRPGQAGFSLMEVTVALAVTVIIILGALQLFDFNTKFARAQTHIAEMQGSLRASQTELVKAIRMAGRGGLRPNVGAVATATGIDLTAISVRDNVVAGTEIAPGYTDSPVVSGGSDVLAIRGTFSSPIYQINSTSPGYYRLFDSGGTPTTNPAAAETGLVEVCARTSTNFVQDLSPLQAAKAAARREALVLVSPLDESIYAVVEFRPDIDVTIPSASCAPGVESLWVAFGTTGAEATAYRQFGSDVVNLLPPNLTGVAYLAILEEYRYYVRESRLVAGGPLERTLSRARVYPGSNVAWSNQVANLMVDIADEIVDFQVALGLDVDNDGTLRDDGGSTDEWLFNAGGSDADDPTDAGWLTVPGTLPARRTTLFYVRFSTLARTPRADPYSQAQAITAIEDRTYDTAANDAINERYRRSVLQTVVDLRNI
jgi:Type IV Pilus-assembly protein W/Prokaryotic N-terminal methylation motif